MAVRTQPDGRSSVSWDAGHSGMGVKVPGAGPTAHLGLRGLQLAASPLPGDHLLFHLLPKPDCLGLQGTHAGPQSQLGSGLLLQQLLWVEGMMGVSWTQQQGRG